MELENLVKGAVALGNEDNLINQLNRKSLPLKDICREINAQAEQKLMKQALEKTNWNRKKASIMLNISYKSMLNKIKEYNIT